MSNQIVSFPPMGADEAERVTEQIAFRIDSITENYEVVMTLMRDALHRNAHVALGYLSPGAYVAERFGRSLQTLGASLRREFVHELSDAGLSTRAIAPVFGVSHKTIVKDRQVVPGVPVEQPETITFDQGGGFTKPGEPIELTTRVTVDTRTGEVIDEKPLPAQNTITGINGKTYTRPEPQAPRAEPITNQFTSAIADLNRVMARMRRVSEDKNFARNKEQIASLHASDLHRTISELETLAESLKGN